jgi:hypothetical protein
MHLVFFGKSGVTPGWFRANLNTDENQTNGRPENDTIGLGFKKIGIVCPFSGRVKPSPLSSPEPIPLPAFCFGTFGRFRRHGAAAEPCRRRPRRHGCCRRPLK